MRFSNIVRPVCRVLLGALPAVLLMARPGPASSDDWADIYRECRRAIPPWKAYAMSYDAYVDLADQRGVWRRGAERYYGVLWQQRNERLARHFPPETRSEWQRIGHEMEEWATAYYRLNRSVSGDYTGYIDIGYREEAARQRTLYTLIQNYRQRRRASGAVSLKRLTSALQTAAPLTRETKPGTGYALSNLLRARQHYLEAQARFRRFASGVSPATKKALAWYIAHVTANTVQ